MFGDGKKLPEKYPMKDPKTHGIILIRLAILGAQASVIYMHGATVAVSSAPWAPAQSESDKLNT